MTKHNRHSTHAGDLPEGRSCSGWDAGRTRRWADRAGPSRREAVGRIFQRVDCEGRGLDAALAVPGLERRHARPRLEGACASPTFAGRRRAMDLSVETRRKLRDMGAADLFCFNWI